MEKIVSINQEDLIITITNEIPGKERGIFFILFNNNWEGLTYCLDRAE